MPYVELQGRKTRKTATHYVYTTRGVGSSLDDTGIPKVEDTLSDADYTITSIDAMCSDVQTDEISEPGRVLFFATWLQPVSRAHTHV